jgi:hypothetical protein
MFAGGSVHPDDAEEGELQRGGHDIHVERGRDGASPARHQPPFTRLTALDGFAGAGSAASFLAGLHVVNGILREESRPNYYPERFLSPDRFRSWTPMAGGLHHRYRRRAA